MLIELFVFLFLVLIEKKKSNEIKFEKRHTPLYIISSRVSRVRYGFLIYNITQLCGSRDCSQLTVAHVL